jgi:hypothetical protein
MGKQKPWLQHYEQGDTGGMTFVSQYHQVSNKHAQKVGQIFGINIS